VPSPGDHFNWLRATADPSQTWIVLDVDRTIVNSTSWYHACVTPGLLLPPELIPEFEALNERAYGPLRDLTDAQFRDATLELLGRGSAPRGLTAADLNRAGRLIGSRLTIYPEPFEFVRLLLRRYGDQLRVLYLTAGYEPFIRGVVERLHQRRRVGGVQFAVFGSRLGYGPGRCQVADVCDSQIKADVVQFLLRIGARIALVADDSHYDVIPFDEVERAGGIGLRIAHQPRQARNHSWAQFMADHGQLAQQHAEVMYGGHPYSLASTDALLETYGDQLDDLPAAPNGIGVGEMERADFDEALGALSARLLSRSDQLMFRTRLTRLVADGPDDVLLRGDLYYLDCPPYLFADSRTARQRWIEQVEVARAAFALLDRSHIFRDWPSFSRAERWLVLCILDHLKNAVTQALDLLVRASVTNDHSEYMAATDALAQRVHSAYWTLLFAGRADTGLAAASQWDHLVRQVSRSAEARFPMRELDDPYVIALSVLSLAGQLRQTQSWPTGIIDFVSGGLELGMAFRAIAPFVAPQQPDVEIAHIVYSSKHRVTSPDARPIEPTYTKMMCRVPPHQRARVERWLSVAGTVLLYDNNVATFATLAATKTVLSEIGLADIRASVACVYYDNIVRWLEGQANEGLCEGWQTTLDYPPVADYLTAFATWGTSMKTRTLDRLYSGRPVTQPDVSRSVNGNEAIFKVCRVHNIVDLNTVLAAGANAIGIHAVSPSEPEYSRSQQVHRPVLFGMTTLRDLPVAHLETGSIRQMAEHIPRNVCPVLVIEQTHVPTEILRIMAAYGLDPQNTTLQIQHRVSSEYLDDMKRRLGSDVICTIGSDQEDFAAYFARLDAFLDPSADLLLIDFSAHQPDFITGRAGLRQPTTGRATEIARHIKGNRIPVLVADDCEPAVLSERVGEMAQAGVLIAGIDTQNSTEVPKAQQRFRLVGDSRHTTQALIRKSPDLAGLWAAAIRHLPATSAFRNYQGALK
jgi:hypothetical protein